MTMVPKAVISPHASIAWHAMILVRISKHVGLEPTAQSVLRLPRKILQVCIEGRVLQRVLEPDMSGTV